MENKKISLKDYIFVGSMLFGLFFGAGNLIFPIRMGQLAGNNIPMANLGFLMTAVGLPFLGILIMGLTNSSGIYELAGKVGKKYSLFFTILLYATIGPFFSLPRLATTAYTIGIEPFVGHSKLFLALFSIIFFGISYLFAKRPTKLLEYVGKWLNPIFLLFLIFLLSFAFIKPLGSINAGKVSEIAYVNTPFIKGLTEGYNTMDVLASLAFGVVVIFTLKNLGLKTPKDIAKGTCKAGIVVVILMAIIYTLLSFTGAMSIGHFKPSNNGGIALAQISQYYLKTYGALFLAIIVILCTLKTSIGLITSIGEAVEQINSKWVYKKVIIVFSCLSAIIANANLDRIIQFSIPILSFLYPLAITLVFLVLLEQIIGYRRSVFQWTTAFALIAAIFDAFKSAPDAIKNLTFVKYLEKLGSYLPLFDIGMGWLIPSLIGLIIGLLISFKKKD